MTKHLSLLLLFTTLAPLHLTHARPQKKYTNKKHKSKHKKLLLGAGILTFGSLLYYFSPSKKHALRHDKTQVHTQPNKITTRKYHLNNTHNQPTILNLTHTSDITSTSTRLNSRPKTSNHEHKDDIHINDPNEALWRYCQNLDNHQYSQELLDNPNINVNDQREGTLIYHAYINKKHDIVNKLLKRNDISTLDQLGGAPNSFLHEICKRGDISTFKKIKNKPLNFNVRNQHRCTPLYMATYNGNIKIINALLKINTIEPNATDDSSFSPLDRFYDYIDTEKKWGSDTHKATWNNLVAHSAKLCRYDKENVQNSIKTYSEQSKSNSKKYKKTQDRKLKKRKSTKKIQPKHIPWAIPQVILT